MALNPAKQEIQPANDSGTSGAWGLPYPELGARTTLVSSDEFGGMAANDGPVPVRALAYAARLMRDARQLARYGMRTGAQALPFWPPV